jgi:hypothetical protein
MFLTVLSLAHGLRTNCLHTIPLKCYANYRRRFIKRKQMGGRIET